MKGWVKNNINSLSLFVLLLVNTPSLFADDIKLDITSIQLLHDNLPGSTLSGNVVTLTKDCEIEAMLSIQKGCDNVVLDLGGKTLSYSTVNGKNNGEQAVCIRVQGGNILVKNGKIKAEAHKGKDGGKGEDGGTGKNALGIVLDNGIIQICDLFFEIIPGEGGNAGKGSIINWFPKDGGEGTPYALKVNGSYTVSDMIPKGVVLLDENRNILDYSENGLATGIKEKKLSAECITYKIEYNYSPGILLSKGTEEYTCEISNFIFPVVTKDGYELTGWLYNDILLTPKELPFPYPTTDVSNPPKLSVEFTAQWKLINYLVKYTGDDVEIENSTYSIENGLNELPEPTREGYRFAGWYRDGVKVSSVPKGTGDVTLIAHWLKIYGINYNVDGGEMPDTYEKEYTEEDEFILPIPKKGTAYFDGWFDESGKRYEKINKGSSGNLELTARWSERYVIIFDVNGGDASSKPSDVEFSQNTDGKKLSTNVTRLGYTFTSWYEDAACMKLFGTSIPAGTIGNKTLYAGWKLTDYTILFYNAPFDKEPIDRLSYTIKDEKALPIPTKTSFTFNGWYNQKTNEPVISIQEGMSGDLKLYAKWSPGYIVNINQPKEGGTISVKQKDNNKEVTSGTSLAKGTELIISVTPSASYALDKLVIGDKSYTASTQTVSMPENGLFITALFKDNRPSASAPGITTDPKSTEKVPVGTDVKVSLQKTDNSTELYYSVDGAPEKKYEGTFVVSSVADTVIVKAIARKSGMKDGITTRIIAFDTNKINLTFDLPNGVKATNPEGGEVVSAVASGGTFEFKLVVDKNYFVSLDSMTVAANDSIIKPDGSGLYMLYDQTGDVKVTVSRLAPKTYTVTLTRNANGAIFFAEDETSDPKTVNYGDNVSVKAEADIYYKFSRWSDGSQYNPHELTITKDTNISATFIPDYKVYSVTLPELEGITVKPFSGYTTEVMRDSTFKFYVQTKTGYRIDGDTVVCANGEVLPKLKGGYMLTYVKKNYSISVKANVVRIMKQLVLASGVSAINLATATDATKTGVYPETMVQVYATAPDGKLFAKWNDGKTDNPRIVTAEEAGQLQPLYQAKPADKSYVKMKWEAFPGAGLAVVNGNVDAVEVGNSVTLKVVLLPSYSQSAVKLLANGKDVNETVSMRSSSATRTLLYSLENVTAETKLTLSGLSVNTYVLTLTQTDGGTVSASQINNITDGTRVTLTATAKSGDIFVKWWDGNTLNPYPYTVTSDTEVKAYFLGAESTVDNESIQKEEKAQITVSGQTLSVTVAEESMLYIWDYKGSLFRNQKIPAGAYTLNLPVGGYLVKVGDMGTRKIIIR